MVRTSTAAMCSQWMPWLRWTAWTFRALRPEEFGGAGADTVTECLVVEELAFAFPAAALTICPASSRAHSQSRRAQPRCGEVVSSYDRTVSARCRVSYRTRRRLR